MPESEVAIGELSGESSFPWVTRLIAFLISGVSITLVGFQLFTGWFSPIDPYAQNIMVVVCICLLGFLWFPLGRKSWKDKPDWRFGVDCLVMLGLFAYIFYVFFDFSGYQARFSSPTTWDYVFGTFMIIVVLEMGRRTVGIILPAICVIVILMNMFANYMPGPFYGSPIKWTRMVAITAMQDFGIYGSITSILATYLLLFFFFSEFMQRTGGARIFLNLALSVAGRFSGGPAKVAVVGSMLMGTMAGAPVANVVGTGSITIPMMKRLGYKAHFAGAVEACASTGAMVVPPVMGTAGFIMAQVLELPYFAICVAAIIPAVLYYAGVFLAVHYQAKKDGLQGLQRQEVPSIRKALLGSWPVAIPIALLFYELSMGYSLSGSIVLCIFLFSGLTLLKRDTRWDARTLLQAFEGAAKMALVAGGCMIVAGIMVGNFWVSGLGDTMARLIATGSGGNLVVGLLITAGVCTILGMGLGAPAVYLTVLVTGIPALIQLGLAPLPAHFFAFYWGMLAALTPPVCMAVFAAMAIAQSKLWPTALAAIKIGIVAYMVSFAFVLNPALLAQGSAKDIALALVPALIGVFAVQSGVAGYFLRRLNWTERSMFFIGGLLLWAPMMTVNMVGLVLVLVLSMRVVVLHRREALVAGG